MDLTACVCVYYLAVLTVKLHERRNQGLRQETRFIFLMLQRVSVLGLRESLFYFCLCVSLLCCTIVQTVLDWIPVCSFVLLFDSQILARFVCALLLQ